jgi:putative spermidine/putrescine transport system ATP-binding protein
MTALRFEHIAKSFGATVALHRFDLDLQPGELVSLLGPSGCGKTTALRIAAGFEKPSGGTVKVNDQDITNLAAHKRNMGMVFQSYSLFPNLSVVDNIEFGLKTRRVGANERARRVSEVLELVQLSELRTRYPHQLSGGQQQRVALARALAVRPDVLLLDEPLSALDAKVRGSLRSEIRHLQRSLGISTLFVTHDQEEALAISDRVGVMSAGRLEQLGTPQEVYYQPQSAFVARFVGTINELSGVVEPSGTSIDVHGVPIPRNGTPRATVVLLARPEDFELVDVVGSASHGNTPAKPVQFNAIVTDVSFQGVLTIVSVTIADSTTTVLVHAMDRGTRISVGDTVGVRIDPARFIIEANERELTPAGAAQPIS